MKIRILKNYVLILFICIIFISISAVSADNTNETDIYSIDNTQYKDIYVSVDGIGDGLSADNPKKFGDITWDEENVHVHMLDGNYNTSFSINKNNTVISAVNKDKVVFNSIGSRISASNVYLIGLTFTSADNMALLIKNPFDKLISNINIIDCTFKNCEQQPVTSAALVINGEETTTRDLLITDVNIIGSKFYNNKGHHDGSAIYGFCIDDIEIKNCEFENNYVFEDHYTFRNSGTVCFEYCNMVTVINSTFKNNTAVEERGGALFVSSKGFVCEDCTFINNTANSGGALYYRYDTSDYKPRTNGQKHLINNCVFVGNTAVYVEYGTDDAYGGAVYIKDYCIISNCLFEKDLGTVHSGNGPYGGAIFLHKQTSGIFNDAADAIINCTFINCAARSGGAIYTASANTIIDNCIFENNTAYYAGGAIHIYKDAKNSKILNSKFSENYGKYGGAIRFGDLNNATIENCTFNKNAGEYGGVIYTQAIDGRILNSNFSENVAASSAGGIYIRGLNTIVDGCEFISNAATGTDSMGGAIYTRIAYSTIKNSQFRNNSASWGGAIEYENDDGIISNCKFVENKATGTGGAIDFYGAGTVERSTFANNEALERTTIYNAGILNLGNNTMETEFAEIYNDGLIVSPTTHTVLDNKTVDALINENKTITSVLVDDKENRIVSGNLTHTIEGEIFYPDFDEYGVYRSYYTPTRTGYIPVYGNYGNATQLAIKNGRLRILEKIIPAQVNVTAEDIMEGEVAKINISFTSDEVVGNLTVIVGDQEFTIELTGNYTGILEVPGLKAGRYNVTVIYGGDEYHTSAENSTSFNVIPVEYVNIIEGYQDINNTFEESKPLEEKSLKENKTLKESDSLKTGNPLLVLLVALFAIPIIRRKK